MSRDWDWAIEAHQNFSKNSEGQDDEQCSPEPTPQCSLTPITWFAIKQNNNYGDRRDGAILQTGKHHVHLVLHGAIWNRYGERMNSPVKSRLYEKVGQVRKKFLDNYDTKNWFHEDMLQLRRDNVSE